MTTRKRPDSWICKDVNGNLNENCPHENAKKFNLWVREKLPDSFTGFCASDIDLVLWNYNTKRFMIIEVKTRNQKIKKYQYIMWEKLNKWLKCSVNDGWEYLGFHLITFKNLSFDDGAVFLDKKEVSEADLIKFLSF